MIFIELENIRKEKRDNQKVVSLLFDSSNRLKTFFLLSSVSDMLMEFQYNLPNPESAEPCSESAKPYAESAQSYAKSAEAYAESAQPYVNIYNAAGQKISKTVSSVNANNMIKHVEYLDGFQYTGGELNFFPHAEGYVNVVLGTTGNRIFNYVYNYTDHLGNIRLSYTKDMVDNKLKIMDENHYYPFGLKHSVYAGGISMKYEMVENMENIARPTYVYETDYNYKYNGKEFQDELGLNLYDYGARNYDAALGRWMNIDPLAEKFVPLSPYSYVANNPIIFIDKQGKIIGNPDGADAKRMQAILSKTETGRQVWNAMVNSDRTIYIHYVSANSDDASKSAHSYLKNQSADGMTVSKGIFESILKDGAATSEAMEKAWNFNESTGKYDKTSDWDETHLLLSEDGLLIESAIETDINGGDEQIGNDMAEMTISGEEAVHSTQNFGDFTEKQKDPKTGKYVQNSNQKNYNNRRHEPEAKEVTQKMKDEYLNQ